MADPSAPGVRGGVFQLFELLDVVPGAFAKYLLPALEPRHQAALALTCSTMRRAVQQNATQLTLRAGKCCLSREHMLGEQLPNIRSVVLKPGNLHEAMFVLPLFFMQAGRAMSSLTSLQLHDQLPDRPPEEVQCGSCSAWASTYDLSAILGTAAHCAPRLAALDFATHYVSDAECAAIALLTGLTRLQLRSFHGTHVGGLSRLSALPSLASLSLADRHCSSRTQPQELVLLLGCSRLTQLSMGPHPLTCPLLNCLAEMHAPAWQAGLSKGPPPQKLQQASAASAAAAAQSAAGIRSALAASCVADSVVPFDPEAQPHLPAPPPLRSLSVTLHPQPRFERALRSACCLTGLTRLVLGWTHAPQDRQLPMSPSWPEYSQQLLDRLTGLQELALGWTPTPCVLAALADMSALTSLHLGGLFSALPEPPAMDHLRLPHISRLAAHMETPPHVLGAAAHQLDPEPLAHGGCVSALAAFPSLTRLELTGRLYGPALAQLPEVLPRTGLRELLLPQRLSADSTQLAALKQLSRLTHLRLGWRSLHHDGPPGYTSVPWHAHQQQVQQQQQLSLAGLVDGPLEDAAPSGAQGKGAPAAAKPAAPAGAGQSASARAAPIDPSAAAPSHCGVCDAPPSQGCLCQLQCLEVVGPLPGAELQRVRQGGRLPSLRRLVLRDNHSWASGTSLAPLADLTSQLTCLELYHCQGPDGLQLEREGSFRQGCRAVVVPRGGVSAAELGRGHQYMGVTLLPGEELGLMPDEPTGDQGTSEELPPEPEPVPPQAGQQQQQQPGQPFAAAGPGGPLVMFEGGVGGPVQLPPPPNAGGQHPWAGALPPALLQHFQALAQEGQQQGGGGGGAAAGLAGMIDAAVAAAQAAVLAAAQGQGQAGQGQAGQQLQQLQQQLQEQALQGLAAAGIEVVEEDDEDEDEGEEGDGDTDGDGGDDGGNDGGEDGGNGEGEGGGLAEGQEEGDGEGQGGGDGGQGGEEDGNGSDDDDDPGGPHPGQGGQGVMHLGNGCVMAWHGPEHNQLLAFAHEDPDGSGVDVVFGMVTEEYGSDSSDEEEEGGGGGGEEEAVVVEAVDAPNAAEAEDGEGRGEDEAGGARGGGAAAGGDPQ